MDESDFENITPRTKSDGVAIDNKHAYVTVVVPSNVLKEEASPSKVIETKTVAVEKGIPVKSRRDKINSLEQKEARLEEAGVTRLKYMRRISEALDAVKTVEYRDAQGNVKYRQEPDVARNQWGVEMAAKLCGDLIERKEIEHDIGEDTLARMKGLTVGELKARAADILLGKNQTNRITDVTP